VGYMLAWQAAHAINAMDGMINVMAVDEALRPAACKVMQGGGG
jgi:hypothetical protein